MALPSKVKAVLRAAAEARLAVVGDLSEIEAVRDVERQTSIPAPRPTSE